MRSFYLRILCLLLVLTFLFALFPIGAAASSFEESLPDVSAAKNVYFENLETGRVIASKNSSEKIAPASTVKILTGLLAIEHFKDDTERIVTVSDKIPRTYDGAYMGLMPGNEILAIDLIYATVCGGYNDAAYALACEISGTPEAFVRLMNSRLLELGATSTYYTNPAGIDDEQMYTTLGDTARLARAAAQNETYMTVSSTVARKISYKSGGAVEELTIHNRNSLIGTHYAMDYVNRYAEGLIAGMTDAGGYCVATKAEIGDASYLCIVMGATKEGARIGSFEIANSLIRYAKSSLGFTKVMEKGTKICEIPIELSLSKSSEKQSVVTVSACIAEDVMLFLPKGIDVASELSYEYYLYSDTLSAPVLSGDRVGGVDFFYRGELIESAPLVIAEDVEANDFLVNMQRFKRAIFSRTTLLSLILFSLLFPFYIFIERSVKSRRSKKSFKITSSRRL